MTTTTLDLDLLQAVSDQVASTAAAVDRQARFPAENVEILQREGLLGLLVPTVNGGHGADMTTFASVCETLGGACASTAMVFLMHSLAAHTVAHGGGARADEHLHALAAGRSLGTLAFSERATGAHFYAPGIEARPTDGGFVISGRKSFVTSGGQADLYLLLVQSGAAEGLDCLAIDGQEAGVHFDGTWEGIGMRGNSSIALELTDVFVPENARIGAPGAGADLVFAAVAPFFLVGLAAVNVGIAAAALEVAVEHARVRAYPDGSTLAEVQSVQHALADLDIQLRGTRLLIQEAARLGDEGDEGALVAIMEAKVAATDAAAAVTRGVLEVCGGQACTPALAIERHLRDAQAGAVMAPTNGVLRSWIGKALTGLPVP